MKLESDDWIEELMNQQWFMTIFFEHYHWEREFTYFGLRILPFFVPYITHYLSNMCLFYGKKLGILRIWKKEENVSLE